MKATLSIAIMALLGHVSAAEITAMSVPTSDSLVQVQSHHHRKHQKSHKKHTKDDELHGHMAPSDDNSPYDPDVADAPEDIKRVDNDHEELHNAKLSPDGYYTGYFHKDFEGKYAQVKNKHHKKHHGNPKVGNNKARFVQLNDHRKDTEDIVENEEWVQASDHDNDSDDVVEEFSDTSNVQSNYEHEDDPDDVVEEFSDMGGLA